MKQLAVIGYPIKHSVSPAMHQAALDSEGIEATYVRVEVAPDDLPAFVDELRTGEWAGINVTVPHKEAIVPLLDELAPEAAAIGAVNTVVISEGKLVGHNTDSAGFLRAIRNDGGFDPEGRVVALLGAGGAARGVLWALAQGRTRKVILFNRTRERAERLAEAAGHFGDWTQIVVDEWWQDPAEWEEALSACELVVNATSVGLVPKETPVPAASIPADAGVVDLIYNPRPTRLLREAAARDMMTLDGLPMLVYQGAAAFELWTGMNAPTGVMRRAAEAALGVVPFEAALRDLPFEVAIKSVPSPVHGRKRRPPTRRVR